MHKVICCIVGLSLCVYVCAVCDRWAKAGNMARIFFSSFFFTKGLLAFWLTLCTRLCVCRHFSSNLAYTIWLDSGFGFGFGPGASEIVRRLQLLAKYFFFLHEIFYLSNPKKKPNERTNEEWAAAAAGQLSRLLQQQQNNIWLVTP